MLPFTRLAGSLRSYGVSTSKRATSSCSKRAASSSKASTTRTLAAKYSRKTQKVNLSSRTYCSTSPFAQPVVGQEQLPRVRQSVRPVGQDGFSRATPFQLYQDIKEGVPAALIDIRPASEFATWHLLGSLNFPLATFEASQVADFPLERTAYVITGGNPVDVPNAVKVAQALKDLGASVTILEYGMKSFPEAGIMYYQDVDGEEARLKAVEAAKAAAAAAAAAARK